MPRSDFVRRHEAAFRDFNIFLVGALTWGQEVTSIFVLSRCTCDLRPGSAVVTLQLPGVTGPVLGLVGLVSVCGDWVR